MCFPGITGGVDDGPVFSLNGDKSALFLSGGSFCFLFDRRICFHLIRESGIFIFTFFLTGIIPLSKSFLRVG